MTQPTVPPDPGPQGNRPRAGRRPPCKGSQRPRAGCGHGQPAARGHDRASPEPTSRRGGPAVSCGRRPPLAVEIEVTWLGTDDADGAAALRAAQGRVLRNVLTAIAAQRATTTHAPRTTGQ
jgi:hypothetical protein